jgi:UDP:flavonoid glycosyltransferase YjiC (YdhE family)
MAMIAESLASSWEALEQHYRPGTVLVGHPISFATRSFEEKTGAPAVTLHLAPSSIRSTHLVPAVPPGTDISGLPLWIKQALWALIDRVGIDPAIVPQLNHWRATHGLPPVHRVLKEWHNSPGGVIGLFPEWFGPRQPDWPTRFDFASFPLWDDAGHEPIDAELEQFLASGPPPVIVSPGSANRQAAAFFATATAAVQQLGLRALFLTGYLDQLPPQLPGSILARRYIPFSDVLPRAAALIHHGGIGTAAQAFAAGVPQLIMPMAFDQPDNAIRARRLGVARWLAPAHFTAEKAASNLSELLSDPAVIQGTTQCRDRLRGISGVKLACDLIERVG